MNDERDQIIHDLTRAVRDLAGRLEALESEQRTPFRPVFIARGEGASEKQWKEQAIVGAAVVDFEDGRSCTADDDAAALIDLGDKFALLAVDDPDGNTRYVKLVASGCFPVHVSSDGGSAGDKNNAASFTYTVTSLDGATQYGTTVPLEAGRSVGLRSAGSIGIGCFDAGTFRLWWVDETEPGSACT